MRRRVINTFVAAVVLSVLIVPAAVEFYTDWLWFGETGYQTVFSKIVASRTTLGAVATVLALSTLLVNIRMAMRNVPGRSSRRGARHLFRPTIERSRIRRDYATYHMTNPAVF